MNKPELLAPAGSFEKAKNHKVRKASRPPVGEIIDNRPESIDARDEFGHWVQDGGCAEVHAEALPAG